MDVYAIVVLKSAVYDIKPSFSKRTKEELMKDTISTRVTP
jgi:hypothetical protein